MTFKGESHTIFRCIYIIFFVCRYFLKTLVPKVALGEIVRKLSCSGPPLFVGFSFQALTLVILVLTKVASNNFKGRHRKWTRRIGKRPKSIFSWSDASWGLICACVSLWSPNPRCCFERFMLLTLLPTVYTWMEQQYILNIMSLVLCTKFEVALNRFSLLWKLWHFLPMGTVFTRTTLGF